MPPTSIAACGPQIVDLDSEPLSQAQKQRPSTPEALKDDSWMSEIEELDMDHRRLRKIANLSRMTNIRRASFCDNEITRIEGLESCVLLEELLLEENRIVRIEHMDHFSNLRKLDLGRNKLTKTDGLEGLTMLTELSLEARVLNSSSLTDSLFRFPLFFLDVFSRLISQAWFFWMKG